MNNAKDLDVVISIQKLLRHGENFPKTPGSLWQYVRDELDDEMTYSESSKFSRNITDNNNNPGTVDVEIQNQFSVNIMLTWNEKCVIANGTGAATLILTDRKIYVSIVTLPTQDNTKLLQQLKSGFKWTGDWNKYQSKM